MATVFGSPGCASDGSSESTEPSTNTGSSTSGGQPPTQDGGSTGEPGESGGATAEGTGGTSSNQGSGGSVPESPGCGKTYDDVRGAWVEQPSLSVGGDERTWWLWVPPNYEPDDDSPVIFLFHGCGDETNNLPLEEYAGEDAILVRGLADGPDGCWLTADETNGDFFVALLEAVSADFCVDQRGVFAVGYDSGAKLVSRLGCYQAYLIDGVATVAGDNALSYGATCNGPVAAMMIHDSDDAEQDISGSEEVRDRLIDQNFCVVDGIPEPVEPEPCVRYSGCGDPVLWCETSGEGHARQDEFAAPAIWAFFSSL